MRKKKSFLKSIEFYTKKITISDISLLAFVNIYYTARKPIYLQYLIKQIFVPLHLTDDDILELTHWAKKYTLNVMRFSYTLNWFQRLTSKV